jgi:hypothetical protein
MKRKDRYIAKMHKIMQCPSWFEQSVAKRFRATIESIDEHRTHQSHRLKSTAKNIHVPNVNRLWRAAFDTILFQNWNYVTLWISANNNKSFFIACYTELGPQSDGILDKLRRAEIGIRNESKVFIIPLNCALGVWKIAEKQKTLPSGAPRAAHGEEVADAIVNFLIVP